MITRFRESWQKGKQRISAQDTPGDAESIANVFLFAAGSGKEIIETEKEKVSPSSVIVIVFAAALQAHQRFDKGRGLQFDEKVYSVCVNRRRDQRGRLGGRREWALASFTSSSQTSSAECTFFRLSDHATIIQQ